MAIGDLRNTVRHDAPMLWARADARPARLHVQVGCRIRNRFSLHLRWRFVNAPVRAAQSLRSFSALSFC